MDWFTSGLGELVDWNDVGIKSGGRLSSVKMMESSVVNCMGVNVLFKRKRGGRVVSIKSISEDVDDGVDPAELIKVGSGVFCVKL